MTERITDRYLVHQMVAADALNLIDDAQDHPRLPTSIRGAEYSGGRLSNFISVESLAQQFIARTLPKSQWTHETHLRVGLWHVLHHGEQKAMDLLRERIHAYNESVGTSNTETSGYHETITKFYVMKIDRFLATADRTLSIDELAVQLLARYGGRDLPLTYYSCGLLFSTQARLHWVEPDLSCI